MDRWGERLYPDNYHFDEAKVISREADIELLHYEIDPKNPKAGGLGLEATRAHLENGVFDDLFEKYKQREAKFYSDLGDISLVHPRALEPMAYFYHFNLRPVFLGMH